MMMKVAILSSVTLLFFSAPILAQKSPLLSGVYDLFVSGSPENRIVAKMEIVTSDTEEFLVRGVGQAWTARGKVSASDAYYDWTFSDGKTGRTTFHINEDGTLTGHVRGSGIDWRFTGRRE